MVAEYFIVIFFFIFAGAFPIQDSDNSSPGSLKFDFFKCKVTDANTTASKFIDIPTSNSLFYYFSNVSIGTPPQPFLVRLDTGSSDSWVRSFNSSTCLSYNTSDYCSDFGSFEPSLSSTYKSNGTEFSIIYGDQTNSNGTWSTDILSFGGFDVQNFNFALSLEDDVPESAIFGIGYSTFETTYNQYSPIIDTEMSYTSQEIPYTYQNLPIQLVSQGLIHKAAYSAYLNSVSSSSGSFLFGAVDTNKFDGLLATIPIITNAPQLGYDSPSMVVVAVSNSLLFYDNKSVLVGNTSVPALIDSGTAAIVLPATHFDNLANALNTITYEDVIFAKCNSGSRSSSGLTFNLSGAKIFVPISDLLVDPSTVGYSLPSSLAEYCLLLVERSSSDYYSILGDPFLRRSYVVYDLEANEISIAQANYSEKENIEVITSSIPSATRVSDYDPTFVYSTESQSTVSTASSALAFSCTVTSAPSFSMSSVPSHFIYTTISSNSGACDYDGNLISSYMDSLYSWLGSLF